MSPKDHRHNGMKQIAMMISEENYNKLTEHKVLTRIPKAVMVDMALTDFFQKKELEQGQVNTPSKINQLRKSILEGD